jgi:hypothetical protein
MDDRAEIEARGHGPTDPPNGAMVAPGGAPPSPALVTREQLARAIGKHSRTIRRWERTRLAPALTVGEDGVHRFDLARVRELVELDERTPPTPDSFDDGDITAAVFELFGQGVEPVEVVMRLKLPATAVEALRRRWVAMRGGYIVDREIAAEICAVRGTTIRDAAALLQCVFRRHSEGDSGRHSVAVPGVIRSRFRGHPIAVPEHPVTIPDHPVAVLE